MAAEGRGAVAVQSAPRVSARARRFIGISLGGGRGKNTAVARIDFDDEGRFVITEARTRSAERGGGEIKGDAPGLPFRDPQLLAWLERWVDEDTLVGIDAPLTLPACIRCTLACPGTDACEVPVVRWMRDWAPRLNPREGRSDRHKPHVTPYTQRATELVLASVTGQPREALGQGMGPLAARATYLRRAMGRRLRVHENLLEVHPRATIWRLFGLRQEQATRVGDQAEVVEARREVLSSLSEGFDFDRVWPELVVRRVPVFHALISAFTVLHASRDAQRGPLDLDVEGEDPTVRRAVRELSSLWSEDGWVFTPQSRATRSNSG